jgi:hypothetical protein
MAEKIFSDVAPRIADAASDAAARVSQTAKDTGRRVAAGVDAQRGHAADMLDSAAESLHAKANDGWPERIAGPAHQIGDGVKRSADYIRRHDTAEMVESFSGVLRRNPGRSILAAAVTGFFVGHWMSRK